eukprot:2867045-Rhodomonas_salina.5
MSSTDLVYAATSVLLKASTHTVRSPAISLCVPYVMPGTDRAYCTFCLRACSAMSGTNVA